VVKKEGDGLFVNHGDILYKDINDEEMVPLIVSYCPID